MEICRCIVIYENKFKNSPTFKFSFQIRNDLKKLHNCLCQFELLPREEKQYDINGDIKVTFFLV